MIMSKFLKINVDKGDTRILSAIGKALTIIIQEILKKYSVYQEEDIYLSGYGVRLYVM